MNIAIMYHYVREPEEWKGSVPISPKAFEQQLDQLGRTHEFVLPDDLNKPTVKPKCVLTFDDATRDQYEHAFSIMQRKGIPGYFTVMSAPLLHKEVPVVHLVHAALSLFSEDFLWNQLRLQLTPENHAKLKYADGVYSYEPSVTRRYIKYTLNYILDAEHSKRLLEEIVYDHYGSKEQCIKELYISIEEFRKIKQAGMTIGVHCVHHLPFQGSAGEYYSREIAPCAEFIQDQLQITPIWYTPPFGGGEHKELMMQSLKDILVSNGYEGAFTTNSGPINDTEAFWFNRLDCNKVSLSHLA